MAFDAANFIRRMETGEFEMLDGGFVGQLQALSLEELEEVAKLMMEQAGEVDG